MHWAVEHANRVWTWLQVTEALEKLSPTRLAEALIAEVAQAATCPSEDKDLLAEAAARLTGKRTGRHADLSDVAIADRLLATVWARLPIMGLQSDLVSEVIARLEGER
jgi:hypothetical protein